MSFPSSKYFFIFVSAQESIKLSLSTFERYDNLLLLEKGYIKMSSIISDVIFETTVLVINI